MTIVNVAKLKEKLSYYLQLIRGGSEVVVTSYDTKIARIIFQRLLPFAKTEQIDVLLNHGPQLAIAARALGFQVTGAGKAATTLARVSKGEVEIMGEREI